MIEEPAKVTKIDPAFIWVESIDESACGQCQSGHGCGYALLGKWIKPKHKLLKLERKQLELEVGDKVLIGFDEKTLVKGSTILYILPLFTVFLFALIGKWIAGISHHTWPSAEGMATLFGLVGLFFSIAIVRYQIHKMSTNHNTLPVVLKKI